jgi:hypothetical protein
MLTLSYDDLMLLINAIKDQRCEHPSTTMQRTINMHIDALRCQLNELAETSRAVSWFTGYSPRVSLDESLAADVLRIKNLLEM